jgi:uncharacterized protein
VVIPEPGVYVGTLRHRRFVPRAHAFQYSLFMVLVDIDRLAESMAVSTFTSYNQLNWASFDERDHIGDPAQPLRDRVRASAEAAGHLLPEGPVLLLTNLRYAGYVFNPISLFYCYDRLARLRLVLAEVNNTYGGRETYWLAPAAGAAGPLRATTDKRLYVSPFMESDVSYQFVLTSPGSRLLAHMTVRGAPAHADTAAPARVFDATLRLDRRPWTAREIRRVLLRFPMMTAKVMAAIHWEALRLYLKGLAVVPDPQNTRRPLTGEIVGRRQAEESGAPTRPNHRPMNLKG